MMSGNGLDIDPLFSMSQKTPAQIISEAKASIYDPGILRASYYRSLDYGLYLTPINV